MKRTGFIVFFLLLSLSAILFFLRAQIGTSLFIFALEQTGAKDIQLELTELNSNTMNFPRVECTLPGNGVKLSLQNVVIDWNRITLRKKHLETITIDTLIVDLPERSSAPSNGKISIEPFLEHLDRFRSLLPFRSLQIDHLMLRGRSAGALAGQKLAVRLDKQNDSIAAELFFKTENLRLSLDTRDRHHWNLTLDQQGQPEPILTTTVYIEAEKIEAEVKTNLARLGLLYPLFNPSLPKLKGTLTGTLSLSPEKKTKADLILELRKVAVADFTADSLQLALHGQMETPGKFVLKNDSLTGSGLHNKKISIADLGMTFDMVLEQQDGHWQYILTTVDKTTIRGINGSNLHIESVQLGPSLRGTFADNAISMNLKPQWLAKLTDFQSGPLNLAEATLATEHDAEITMLFDKENSWRVAPSDWQLTTSMIQVQQQQFDLAPVHFALQQLAGSGKDWQFKTRLTSESLDIRTSGKTLSLRYISSELNGKSGKITGTATCMPKTVPGLLAIDFSQDLKQGKTEAMVNTKDPLLFSEMTPLSTIVTPWSQPGDLTGGQLQILSAFSWQTKQPVQLSLQANLSGGKGTINIVRFSGLSTNQDLQIFPEIQSRKKGEITIDEVNTGITLENISTKITLNPSPHGRIPVITLQDMTASLLGGTIHDDFLAIDPQRLEIENTITINDIDLAQAITLHQVKGLAVEGRIHGTLPFQIDKTGLQIKEGTLQSTPPGGIIRYTPPEGNGLQNSALTGYALKALEEFHYERLNASTRYTPDGELQVSLHLEGRSPKLETNRPVHLNINTEQNVLSLLRSLRYSKGLTDEIDKEVQQQYQHSAP